jgi:hypothetical protein
VLPVSAGQCGFISAGEAADRDDKKSLYDIGGDGGSATAPVLVRQPRIAAGHGGGGRRS